MFSNLEIWQECCALIAIENESGNIDEKPQQIRVGPRPQPSAYTFRFLISCVFSQLPSIVSVHIAIIMSNCIVRIKG